MSLDHFERYFMKYQIKIKSHNIFLSYAEIVSFDFMLWGQVSRGSGDQLTRDAAKRKPTLPWRLPGEELPRSAERKYEAS